MVRKSACLIKIEQATVAIVIHAPTANWSQFLHDHPQSKATNTATPTKQFDDLYIHHHPLRILYNLPLVPIPVSHKSLMQLMQNMRPRADQLFNLAA